MGKQWRIWAEKRPDGIHALGPEQLNTLMLYEIRDLLTRQLEILEKGKIMIINNQEPRDG